MVKKQASSIECKVIVNKCISLQHGSNFKRSVKCYALMYAGNSESVSKMEFPMSHIVFTMMSTKYVMKYFPRQLAFLFYWLIIALNNAFTFTHLGTDAPMQSADQLLFNTNRYISCSVIHVIQTNESASILPSETFSYNQWDQTTNLTFSRQSTLLPATVDSSFHYPSTFCKL